MISIAVVVYQIAFIAIIGVASSFGKRALGIAVACCMLWTATHVFYPPLAIFQSIVVLGSGLFFWGKIKDKKKDDR